MVDKPDAGKEGSKTEIKESSTLTIDSASVGSTPTTGGQEQTQNANKARQYAEYVMGLRIPFWKRFQRFIKWLDDNNGAITALATVAIGVLTYFYVTYSREQWKVMSDQLKEMKSQSALQIKIARLNNGQPIMKLGPLGIFHEGETGKGKVWTKVNFVNSGSREADSPRVVIKFDFLSRPPTPSQRDFVENEFTPIKEGRFKVPPDPQERNPIRPLNPVYLTHPLLEIPGMNGYVWGEVRYIDWTQTPNEPFKFCRYATARDIFDAKTGDTGGYGGGVGQTPWGNCDQ